MLGGDDGGGIDSGLSWLGGLDGVDPGASGEGLALGVHHGRTGGDPGLAVLLEMARLFAKPADDRSIVG